jgi:hypothetical protein
MIKHVGYRRAGDAVNTQVGDAPSLPSLTHSPMAYSRSGHSVRRTCSAILFAMAMAVGAVHYGVVEVVGIAAAAAGVHGRGELRFDVALGGVVLAVL